MLFFKYNVACMLLINHSVLSYGSCVYNLHNKALLRGIESVCILSCMMELLARYYSHHPLDRSKYRSVPGKRPWALKHNLRFQPAWALTRDINSICLYGSCNSDPLKFGTWALTREWALAWDTTVYIYTL